MNKLRRLPWAAIWSDGPWDGVVKPVERVRLPSTAASLVPAINQQMTSLKRIGFGRLLSATPWTGKPKLMGRVAFDVPAVPLAATAEALTVPASVLNTPQEAIA